MIDELFIVTRHGIPLATWSSPRQKKRIDPGLVGGFLSAVGTFAGGTTGQEIKAIGLDPSLLLFEDKGEVLFVVMVRNRQAQVLGEHVLRAVSEQFMSEFGDAVQGFTGSIEKFVKFRPRIKQLLAEAGVDAIEKWHSNNNAGNYGLGGLLLLNKERSRLLYKEGKAVQNLDPILFLVPSLVDVSNNLIDRLNGGQMIKYTAYPMEPEQLSIENRGLATVVKIIETGRDWHRWTMSNVKSLRNVNITPSSLGEQTTLPRLLKNVVRREKVAPLVIGMHRTGDSWVFKNGKAQENVLNNGLVELRRWWALERQLSEWIFNSELWISRLEGIGISAFLINLGSFAVLQVGDTKLIRHLTEDSQIQRLILDLC
ncbi:MAG: hypothetical protein ACTSYO_08650 [Candidatus Ranarchaeia archaeon]